MPRPLSWQPLMRHVVRSLSAVLLASTLFAAHADAATIVARDVAYLTDTSDLIVRGTVDAIRTSMGEDGKPYTHTGLAVQESWKGNADSHIEVTQLGGPFPDGRVLHIDGDLDLRVGMELVIFLRKTDQGLVSTLLGWSAFELDTGLGVHRHQTDFGLMSRDDKGVLLTTDVKNVDSPVNIIDLRTRVRRAMGGK